MQHDDTRSQQLDAQPERRRVGLLGELLAVLLENKKWWLVPILVMWLLVGALFLLASSAAAPLVYPLY